MPVVTETSTVGEYVKLRRPRSQFGHSISETDPCPNPEVPSAVQSSRCKSLLLSTLSNNTDASEALLSTAINKNRKKKNNFPAAPFRGLGCTASASQQVSVPALIRDSADWQGKKTRKKKQKNSKGKSHQGPEDESNFYSKSNLNSSGCLDIPDVWCGPGIGFSADAAASVDCLVARRNISARGKIDGEKITHREFTSIRRQPPGSFENLSPLKLERIFFPLQWPSNSFNGGLFRPSLSRRTLSPETISFLDFERDLETRRQPEAFGTRYYRHARHPTPEGLAEIMTLQSSMLMGGRIEDHDQFRDWRLDVDHMTYEELLELSDRIGYVCTGLKEDEIGNCVRKIKLSILNELSSHLPTHADRKCSICQEEYEANDEMGKLECGHSYHVECIKQWLTQKNTCPVCKTAAAVQR